MNNTTIKKYKKKQNQSSGYYFQQYTNRLATSNQSPYIKDIDKQKSNDYETLFDFQPKKILHLWLAQVLPGPKFLNIRYNFSQKKISGQQQACKKKIKECEKFVQDHKMKLLSGIFLQHNNLLYLQKKIDYRIFRFETIKAACDDLIKNQGFRQLKKDVQPILQKKNVYLISIKISNEPVMMKWWQQVNNGKVYKRKQIQQAYQQRKKLRKYVAKQQQQYTSESQPQILNDTHSGNQSNKDSENSRLQDQHKSQQSCQQNNSASVQEQDDIQQFQKIQQKTLYHNGNDQEKQQQQFQKNDQTNQKQDDDKIVINQSFNKSSFDVNLFKDWVKMHKNLQIQQFQFSLSKNKVKIVMRSQNNVEKKRNTVYFYLRNSKFILLNKEQQSIIQLIKKNLCCKSKKTLQCKIIEGYSKPQASEQQIRRFYEINKLSNKKTKVSTKRIVGIFIKGVKPDVDQCTIEVRKILKRNEKQNFMLDLPDIQPYLQDNRVQKVLEEVVIQVLKKYQYLKLLAIFCPGSKATLSLQISIQHYKNFINCQLLKLKEDISSNIKFDSMIMNYQDLTQQLSNKYLLFRSKQNEQKVVLISNSKQAMSLTKKIMHIVNENAMLCDNKQISIKKSRLTKLKQFVKKQQQRNPLMKNFKIVFNCNQSQAKIEIFGSNKKINQVIDIIKQQLVKLDEKTRGKTFTITQLQLNYIKRNLKKYQTYTQTNFKMPFILSENIGISSLITLSPNSQKYINNSIKIQIYKKTNFLCLENKVLLIFLSKNDFSYLQEKSFLNVRNNIQPYVGSEKINIIVSQEQKYSYIYYDQFKTINAENLSTLIKCSQPNRDVYNNYAFFMPKNEKYKFIEEILKCFYNYFRNQKSNIIVFDNSYQNIENDLTPLKKISQQSKKDTKTIYFINDFEQLYYSQQGNIKIEQAMKKGSRKVYLSNSDLNLIQPTHLCSFEKQKMIHISSKKQINLLILPGKVYYILNGIQFQMPQQQILKVQRKSKKQEWVKVSIGVYEVDFDRNIQTNLFSGYTRNLLKKQIKLQKPFGDWQLNLNFNCKANEIQIQYQQGQLQQLIAEQACRKLKNMIQSQKIQIKHSFPKILSNQQIQSLIQHVNQLNIEIKSIRNQQINLIGFDKMSINFVKKYIENLHKDDRQRQIKFPQTWVKQSKQIQDFIVNPESEQFKKVQQNFQIFPIKELLRIQNKIVYKKYHNQKQFLKQINDGKIVKQMMLYHGTSKTDPRQIYEDKQQCFNINYTSNQNLFGRGIYFAERAEYSKTYQHTNKFNQRSMLYCSVLVGDSQHVELYSNVIKDTQFKDPIKKIRYQSITHKFTKSQIYVVYKSARAYPHYLIKY